MTANELRAYFNNVFGLNPWPKTFEVDDETYENCLKAVEDWQDKHQIMYDTGNKLMFKGVELIRIKK